MSVAKLLGILMAQTQEQEKNRKQPMIGNNKNANTKSTSLEDALGLLSQGFLKGGVGSFLKDPEGASQNSGCEAAERPGGRLVTR